MMRRFWLPIALLLLWWHPQVIAENDEIAMMNLPTNNVLNIGKEEEQQQQRAIKSYKMTTAKGHQYWAKGKGNYKGNGFYMNHKYKGYVMKVKVPLNGFKWAGLQLPHHGYGFGYGGHYKKMGSKKKSKKGWKKGGAYKYSKGFKTKGHKGKGGKPFVCLLLASSSFSNTRMIVAYP